MSTMVFFLLIALVLVGLGNYVFKDRREGTVCICLGIAVALITLVSTLATA